MKSAAQRMMSGCDRAGKFYGVGQWYEDFSQTSDDEVRALLAEAAGRRPVCLTVLM